MSETPSDRRSVLWANVASRLLEASSNIDSFRSPGGANSRLAHWAPNEPTFRWFKSYLQLAASTVPPAEAELLELVTYRTLGDPLTVTVSPGGATPLTADLDYLYAAEEVAFLLSTLPVTEETCRVVELGAGFGRTAHLALAALPSLEQYTIVDLPEALALSRAYLQKVVDSSTFAKLEFIDASEAQFGAFECDLFIQVDGFQEMDEATVNWYLDELAAPSQFSYVSNPVGKYDPSHAGVEGMDPDGLSAALKLGLSRRAIDPWDERTLVSAREEHARRYCPTGHTEIASVASRLRPHYLHSLYGRNTARTPSHLSTKGARH